MICEHEGIPGLFRLWQEATVSRACDSILAGLELPPLLREIALSRRSLAATQSGVDALIGRGFSTDDFIRRGLELLPPVLAASTPPLVVELLRHAASRPPAKARPTSSPVAPGDFGQVLHPALGDAIGAPAADGGGVDRGCAVTPVHAPIPGVAATRTYGAYFDRLDAYAADALAARGAMGEEEAVERCIPLDAAAAVPGDLPAGVCTALVPAGAVWDDAPALGVTPVWRVYHCPIRAHPSAVAATARLYLELAAARPAAAVAGRARFAEQAAALLHFALAQAAAWRRGTAAIADVLGLAAWRAWGGAAAPAAPRRGVLVDFEAFSRPCGGFVGSYAAFFSPLPLAECLACGAAAACACPAPLRREGGAAAPARVGPRPQLRASGEVVACGHARLLLGLPPRPGEPTEWCRVEADPVGW